MMSFTKQLGAAFAIAVVVSGSAVAADTIAVGKVKSIDAEAKSFVMTDSADKEFTFKFGDHFVVNRAGKEGKGDLKVGDAINVSYDKGIVNRTASYVLVQDGDNKNCELIRGAVKGYDADRKELTFTHESKKDATYPMGDAVVRLNREEVKIESVKIGDNALLIVQSIDGKATLKSLMAERAAAATE